MTVLPASDLAMVYRDGTDVCRALVTDYVMTTYRVGRARSDGERERASGYADALVRAFMAAYGLSEEAAAERVADEVAEAMTLFD